jgi:hypothetical protein
VGFSLLTANPTPTNGVPVFGCGFRIDTSVPIMDKHSEKLGGHVAGLKKRKLE